MMIAKNRLLRVAVDNLPGEGASERWAGLKGQEGQNAYVFAPEDTIRGSVKAYNAFKKRLKVRWLQALPAVWCSTATRWAHRPTVRGNARSSMSRTSPDSHAAFRGYLDRSAAVRARRVALEHLRTPLRAEAGRTACRRRRASRRRASPRSPSRRRSSASSWTARSST